MERKNAWAAYAGDDGKVEAFAKAYCDFINNGKTERECVAYGEKLAKAHGFEDLNAVVRSGRKLNAGARVYVNWMGKSFMLFVLGEKPLEEGMNILGAHIDSPRIDVKQNPLYEDTDLAYLDTHYYGGIKKYQWVAIPLALHGVIVRKTGEKVIINIGEDENDPVFCISDLLVHLAQEQMTKNAKEVVEGEALNLIVGGRPLEGEEKDAVKANVLKLLADKYGVEEEDFLSAELEIVPAGKARDMGFDRSMILAYGHDDRVCAYPSMMAVLDYEGTPEYTLCCIVTDKEEIGSVGATGMASHYLENTVAELYACTADYHTTIRTMLLQLFDALRTAHPGLSGRAFVDTAPLAEKQLAAEAGLGWIGRQSLLVTPQFGTYVLLGELLLTDEADAYDAPFEGSRCGRCRNCIESCPTGAIVAPKVIDTGRCISCHTIEREPSGGIDLDGWIFGCDRCQSCCPHNQKAPMHANRAFDPVFDPLTMDAAAWMALDETEFEARMGATPLTRSGLARIRGNIKTE